MGKIYLIRHGETAWNKGGAYAGSTDIPLNDTGRRQAEMLAERLTNLDAVYSSDLSRARDTARTIAERSGLDVQEFAGLQEVNYGEWEGVSEAEIAVRYADLYQAWRENPAEVSTPNGESFGAVRDRAMAVFSRIAREHADEEIAIVAHKSVNRVILCELLGMEVNSYRRIAQENVCINTISYRDDRFVVESVNDRCHLNACVGSADARSV
ncbi:MAG: alpha-ribazole phosphatase [Armatimonadota bacterium]